MFARSLLLAFLVTAPRLEAQLNGVPVWPVGLPNPTAPAADAIAAFHTTSGDDFVGPATPADPGITIGFDQFRGRLTLRALAGLVRRDVTPLSRSTEYQFAVLGGLNLLHAYLGADGHEAGVSVLGGYGTSTLSVGYERNVLAGVDASAAIAMGGWFLEPAVIPRWSWRRTKTGTGSDWQQGPAVGAALTAGFPFGLRLQLAGERVFLNAGDASPPALPRTRTYAWSVAVRYRL
jgi:hypothetical protein